MYSKLRKTLSRAAATAVIASLLAAAASAPSMTTSVNATSSPSKSAASGNNEYDIVVLGDSLAAGYQLGFTEQSVPYGYAEHVYEQALFQGLRTKYSNYGLIGLRSEGLSKWLSAAAAGQPVSEGDIQANLPDPRAEAIFAKTAQLEKDISDAELILISIGGNDFLQLLNKLDLNASFDSLPEQTREELKSELATLLESYEIQLDKALSIIQKLQPNAQIVISNQYLPIPFLKVKDQITYYIPEATARFLVDGQTKLLQKLESVLSDYSDNGLQLKIANAAAAIESSVLTYTSINDKDIHPTKSGYMELGKAFAEQVWGAYKTVKKRPANVPISIVVGGKEINTDFAPVIKNNRTFLALRDVTDALGAELQWDGSTSTATISLEDRVVAITIGSKTIVVNGKKQPLNAEPAYLQPIAGESKTYVPLAALSDGLGFQVVYRETIKTAFINR